MWVKSSPAHFVSSLHVFFEWFIVEMEKKEKSLLVLEKLKTFQIQRLQQGSIHRSLRSSSARPWYILPRTIAKIMDWMSRSNLDSDCGILGGHGFIVWINYNSVISKWLRTSVSCELSKRHHFPSAWMTLACWYTHHCYTQFFQLDLLFYLLCSPTLPLEQKT